MRTLRHTTLAVLSLLGSAALAGGLDVAPVQLHLSAERPSAVLSVRNRGDTTRRYQVTLSAWAQSPDGQMQLEDSAALTYFPRILTLKPGEERSIRVGAQGKPAAVEQTYRVFVEELPSEAAAAPQAVQVLTKIGVPIFVAPVRSETRAAVEALTARGGKVSFTLRNSGTVHVRPTSVRVTATDAKGATVFEQLLPAWYVLGQTERRYTVDVPADRCAAARSWRVLVAAQAQTFEATSSTPNGACGP